MFCRPTEPRRANLELRDEGEREFHLRNKLAAVTHKYDYILIDCPRHSTY